MLAAQARGLLAPSVSGGGWVRESPRTAEAAWGWLRNGAGMLRCVAAARAVEDIVVPAQQGPESAAPMDLSYRICLTGETVVDFGGELDILSAEVAVSYVRDVIDRHHGPVTVNLTALAFCDAKGLAALVRMARYAEQQGRPFRLASPSPSLVKIMRITGLDRRFLACQPSGAGPSAA
jgi:anti-anti-sigma factor